MKSDVQSPFSSHQLCKHVVPSIGANWREQAVQEYLLATFIIIFIIILITSVVIIIIIIIIIIITVLLLLLPISIWKILLNEWTQPWIESAHIIIFIIILVTSGGGVVNNNNNNNNNNTLSLIIIVTRPSHESRVNWVVDPAPPASRQPSTEASPASTPAILMPPSGAPFQPPRRLKSRRRKAARSANRNSASRQADLATPRTRSANENSARWRATQPRSGANDLPGMKSTSVEHPRSFTSSPLTQLPIPTANQNSRSSSRRDHSEIWGLYKPAQTDPRQDLTATHTWDNISGFGLSSPAPQQPPTKPFSGSPSRHSMTDPYREARDAEGERPGIIYPLLPRTACPDTRLQINAALPEAAALDRRTRPPTVLDIAESRLLENHQPQGPRLARHQSRKWRRNRSTGVYRPSKHSPPRGHWCE